MKLHLHGLAVLPFAVDGPAAARAEALERAAFRPCFRQRGKEVYGKAPFRVTGDGVCPFAVRRDLDDGRTVAGFMNFSNDPWEEVVFHLPDAARFATAAVLEEDGQWRAIPYAPLEGRWTLRRTVPAKRALFVVLE